MSLVDEANVVRQRIVSRLRELEPFVREYEELRRVAAEMGVEEKELGSDVRSAGVDERARRTGRKPPRVARAKPSAGDQAADLRPRALEAVRAQPGKTVAEYAEILGVPPTVLYRPVRELTTEGAVVKRARELYPS